MIDFLLCVVLFLLSAFTSSGEPCIERRVRVPGASSVLDMIEAPMVTVVGTQIFVDGVSAGRVESRAKPGERVEELFSILKNKRELWRQINPGRPFPGALVIRAEGDVSALLVKNVIATAQFAGYPHPSFMVRRLPRAE